MPPSETPKGILVRKYILKYPNLSKRAIAIKLYNEHRIFFSSVENARNMVRAKTGARGKYHRMRAKNIIKHNPVISTSNKANRHK